MANKKEDRQGCVYHVINVLSGKGYVGQHGTENAERRWNGHVTDAVAGKSTTPFHRALRKYGIDGFTWDVIWRGPVSKLDVIETEFIKQFNTLKPAGYNLTLGGPTTRGLKLTKVQRGRQSKSRRKYLSNHPEAVQHQSDAIRNKWQEEAYRMAVSTAVKAALAKPSVKRKLRASQQASWTAERRAAQGRMASKRFKDPACRKSLSAAVKRTMSTPEYRKKRSCITKKLWKDPVYSENCRQSQRAYLDSSKGRAEFIAVRRRPDVVAKIGATHKNLWQQDWYRKKQSKSRLASWARRKATACDG